MISGTEDGVLSLPNKLGFRRRPLLTPDPFGVFSEAFARYMGTPAFIGWMSVSARLEHLGSPRVEQCHRVVATALVWVGRCVASCVDDDGSGCDQAGSGRWVLGAGNRS